MAHNSSRASRECGDDWRAADTTRLQCVLANCLAIRGSGPKKSSSTFDRWIGFYGNLTLASAARTTTAQLSPIVYKLNGRKGHEKPVTRIHPMPYTEADEPENLPIMPHLLAVEPSSLQTDLWPPIRDLNYEPVTIPLVVARQPIFPARSTIPGSCGQRVAEDSGQEDGCNDEQ